MIGVGLLAAFVPAEVAGEMTSIGTLFAFILVCAGVLIVRRTMPDRERAFRVPWVPAIPIMGIISCFIVMISLPADTWIRLIVWMLIGLDVYLSYGIFHSRLDPHPSRRGQSYLNMLGIAISVLCTLSGFWHQQLAGWKSDKTLLIVALVFGLGHMAFWLHRIFETHVKG